MDQLLLPLCAGAVAQLCSSARGWPQPPVQLVILLLAGMSPLMALFHVQAAALFGHALSLLLVVRMGNDQQALKAGPWLWVLPGAALGIGLLLLLPPPAQTALVLLALLLSVRSSRIAAARLAALLAGAVLACCGAGRSLLEKGVAAPGASVTAAAVLATGVISCLAILGQLHLQSPTEIWTPVLLPVLGLLAGTALAASCDPRQLRQRPDRSSLQTD